MLFDWAFLQRLMMYWVFLEWIVLSLIVVRVLVSWLEGRVKEEEDVLRGQTAGDETTKDETWVTPDDSTYFSVPRVPACV